MSHLDWPFFGDAHRAFARDLELWAEREAQPTRTDEHDVDMACRNIVRQLGTAGWLRHTVPAAFGGATDRLDVRTLCIAREILGRHNPLADFAFAMQGLGAGPISLFGSDTLKERYLPRVAAGESIAAFALSERDAGSDVTAMKASARRDGTGWVLDGEKTWISNAGIADHYVVFCRMPDQGDKAFGAFVVDAGTEGFRVTERLNVIAPHPLGTIVFAGCQVRREALVGEAGRGLRVALGTLDVFRSTVGAAAVGFARRALADVLAHVATRRAFGQRLEEFQLVQASIAEMAVAVDASALLVYRAAWTRDNGADRVTREAAMAKLFATESAQRVIDQAVQLFGGRGVTSGEMVERLYREIRALRIYEGTSDILKLVIARALFEENRLV